MSARAGKRRALTALCLLGVLLFAALGIWQVERRAWKLDLIARVNARLAAAPVPAPPPNRWADLDARAQEYLRVTATGVFLHDKATPVDALTELGAGTWLLTPLRTNDGIILVNRGFVPKDARSPTNEPAGTVTVTGLLRASEPKGRLLRPNRPQENRWFSRDVAAIAAARGLVRVAPYFIDADAVPGRGYPIGGLTVVRFRNMHLVYALTWFALAALCGAGLVLLRKPAQELEPWTPRS